MVSFSEIAKVVDKHMREYLDIYSSSDHFNEQVSWDNNIQQYSIIFRINNDTFGDALMYRELTLIGLGRGTGLPQYSIVARRFSIPNVKSKDRLLETHQFIKIDNFNTISYWDDRDHNTPPIERECMCNLYHKIRDRIGDILSEENKEESK